MTDEQMYEEMLRELKKDDLWITPTVTQTPPRTKQGWIKRAKHRKDIGRKTMRPGNLEEQVLLMEEHKETRQTYPTPTASDTKDDCFIYAAKLLAGKTNRISGHHIQVTLSDKVGMEELKKNPELYAKYREQELRKRTKLPTQKEFVEYLRSQTTARELQRKLEDYPFTKIEHWFRRGQSFAYPSVEDWENIKPHLKVIKFDYEMQFTESIEWTAKMPRQKNEYPTPKVTDSRHAISRHLDPENKHWKSNLGEVVMQKEFPQSSGGKMRLSPEFTEWLMGYPIGWTGLKDVGTDKFQEWCRLHGKSSVEDCD